MTSEILGKDFKTPGNSRVFYHNEIIFIGNLVYFKSQLENPVLSNMYITEFDPIFEVIK